MPTIPGHQHGYTGTLNYVSDMWQHRCGANWYVYAKAARATALDAVVRLGCFDLDDIVREVFRPAGIPGLRSGSHHKGRPRKKGGRGRRPKRLGRAVNAALNPGESIGKLLSDPDTKGRKVSAGVHTLWEVDGLMQRGMFWWLIIDTAIEEAYNFTSLLYRSEQCQDALKPGFCHGAKDGFVLSALGDWRAVTVQNVQSEGNAAIAGGGAQFSGGEYHCVGSLTCDNIAPGATVDVRIRYTVPGGDQYSEVYSVTGAGAEKKSLMVAAKKRLAIGATLEARLTGGGADHCSATLTASGVPPYVPPPDRYTCSPLGIPVLKTNPHL